MGFEQKIATALNGIVSIQKYLTGRELSVPSVEEVLDDSIILKDYRNQKQGHVVIKFDQAVIQKAITSDNIIASSEERYTPSVSARRKVFLRDLMTVEQTDELIVYYPRETSYTNNAGPQATGSPLQTENVSLGESALTFELAGFKTITIGHHLTVSNQILHDSKVLSAFLRNRLFYGLRIAEEYQILQGVYGDGGLAGLLNNASVYTAESPQLTLGIDIIRDAIEQLELNEFSPQAIVLHPTDWRNIELRKAGAGDDSYVAGDPKSRQQPVLWGLPVVSTPAMVQGQFLVGDFARGAILFDYQTPEVATSRQHSDNFQKNMVTAKVDERVTVAIPNSNALIKGSLI